MSEHETHNAVIESVSIGGMDRGFSGWVRLKMGGAGIGFGGFNLCGPYAHKFISRCCEVVGVECWEQLKGKPCRVVLETWSGPALKLGNFIEEEWFDIRTEFAQMKQGATNA